MRPILPPPPHTVSTFIKQGQKIEDTNGLIDGVVGRRAHNQNCSLKIKHFQSLRSEHCCGWSYLKELTFSYISTLKKQKSVHFNPLRDEFAEAIYRPFLRKSRFALFFPHNILRVVLHR